MVPQKNRLQKQRRHQSYAETHRTQRMTLHLGCCVFVVVLFVCFASSHTSCPRSLTFRPWNGYSNHEEWICNDVIQTAILVYARMC
jgi:hypothetical protein